MTLANKIARLVEERGWNQDEFARQAGLNRQTVRTILQEGGRKLRNTTVSRCARALGLPVTDLRTLPLDRLLPRMNGQAAPTVEGPLRTLHDRATQPELLAWIERNPERARQLTTEEVDELLSLQDNGHLATMGAENFVAFIERKRRLIQQLHAISGTEYIDLLEQFLNLLYDKIQPYRDRR